MKRFFDEMMDDFGISMQIVFFVVAPVITALVFTDVL